VTTIAGTGVAAMKDEHAARVSLKRELGELDRLSAWLQAIEKQIGLVPDVAFALELCLEEAIANIIMYGDAKNQGDIRVTVRRSSPGLVAKIEDDGRQFDPTTVPAPILPQSLEDAETGNLGVHLIRTFATDMRYERNSGLNTLTLTFASAAES
jgi:anti-sigma regulatory factor (Ser/Thr protein kinase)